MTRSSASAKTHRGIDHQFPTITNLAPISTWSDSDLVALILGQPLTVPATNLVKSLRVLSEGRSSSDLNLPYQATQTLLAAVELGKRVLASPLERLRSITSSADVYAALGPELELSPVEHVVAIALDSHLHPLAIIPIALGSSASCHLSPADFWKPVLVQGAYGAIMVHNHPSGDPTPSPQDVALTRRVAKAAKLLGLVLFDHVIIGHGCHFGFVDGGLL